MNTQLVNTSSIFQLAIGVNAVFAVILNYYLNHRKELATAFAANLRQHRASFSVEGKEKHIAKYLFRATIGYRIVFAYFLCCVVLAGASILISFYYLLMAALHPSAEISALWLICLSIVTVLVNPIVYFVFFKVSEWYLSAVRERMKLDADSAELIESLISSSTLIERSNNLLADIQVKRLILNLRPLTHLVTHPIRYLRQRKVLKRAMLYNTPEAKESDDNQRTPPFNPPRL